MNNLSPILKDKRIIFMIILIILTVIFLSFHKQLTSGNIIVKTNSTDNLVSVLTISKVDKQSTVASKLGGLNASLSPGNYEIEVSNSNSSIINNITVKSRENKTYNINLNPTLQSQSVLSDGASNLAANSSFIQYIDYDKGGLYEINSGGLPTNLDPSLDFISAAWLNPTQGIAQTNDDHLYSITNGVITPLAVPFSYSSNHVSYSISPNGNIYVSNGNTVYVSANGVNWSPYFASSSDEPAIVAGVNKVAILDPINEYDTNIRIVSLSGKLLYKKEINASGLVWSPNDSQFVTTGDGPDSSEIFTSSLEKVSTLPGDLTQEVWSSGVVWKNSTVLYYGRSQNLWEYDQQTGQGSIISTTPDRETITGTFFSQDGNYIYFTGANLTSSSSILLRVGLTSVTQNIPSYYSGLSILFPTNTADCSFTYSNFLAPYIIITGWVDPATCQNEVQTQLSEDGLPPAGFSITFSQTNLYNE